MNPKKAFMSRQNLICSRISISSDYKSIVIKLLFSLFAYIRCRCLLIIIVRSSCLRSKENLNHQQHYPLQAVLIVLLYFSLLHLPFVLIKIMFLPRPPVPSLPHVLITRTSPDKNEMIKTLRILVPLPRLIRDNFLVTFVAVALISVRAHVNVPFHQRHFKMKEIHRILLAKLVPVLRRLVHPTIVVRNLNLLLDFLLSTDHLRRYISEQRLIERKTRPISLPKFTLFLLLLSSLFPLTLARTFPSAQSITLNRNSSIFDDFTWNSSTSAALPLNQRPYWNVGCCLRKHKTTLEMCDTSLNVTAHSLQRNDNLAKFYEIDFLNNETLFCQRYQTFRYLSSKPLAKFTYSIVIIGILLNFFVFLVLMCGSLRRSTSFVLFLALTCFDLLSLASSVFSLLFRTAMTYLKASAPFCKMFAIFFLYFRQCSSTTLLLIAVERCIVIKYPFCRHTFNKFRLPLLALIMFIFVVPIAFDFLFYTSGPLHCEAFDTEAADRYQIFRGFFTVFSYAIIPFVGITISNFLIIMELKKSRKRFMTKDANGTMRRFSTK